jgi:transposase-like protein
MTATVMGTDSQYALAERIPYVPPWYRRLLERVKQRAAWGVSLWRIAEDEGLDVMTVAQWVNGPDAKMPPADPDVATSVARGMEAVRDGASIAQAAAYFGVTEATLFRRCIQERVPLSHPDDRMESSVEARRVARAKAMSKMYARGGVSLGEVGVAFGLSRSQVGKELRDYNARRGVFHGA